MYSVKVYEDSSTSTTAEASGQFIQLTIEHNRHIERTWLTIEDAKELAEGILFMVEMAKSKTQKEKSQ
jgi:hypothetical protein